MTLEKAKMTKCKNCGHKLAPVKYHIIDNPNVKREGCRHSNWSLVCFCGCNNPEEITSKTTKQNKNSKEKINE